MSGTLEAYGGPTEGVTKVCGCGTLEVLDDADVFSRMYERDSETGPVVLGAADAGCGRRGGVDGGDVRAGAVLLAAAAGVGAGAGAGLALYGGAAPVRPVSADRRFVIEQPSLAGCVASQRTAVRRALLRLSRSELRRPARYFRLPRYSAKPLASADTLNSCSQRNSAG